MKSKLGGNITELNMAKVYQKEKIPSKKELKKIIIKGKAEVMRFSSLVEKAQFMQLKLVKKRGRVNAAQAKSTASARKRVRGLTK